MLDAIDGLMSEWLRTKAERQRVVDYKLRRSIITKNSGQWEIDLGEERSYLLQLPPDPPAPVAPSISSSPLIQRRLIDWTFIGVDTVKLGAFVEELDQQVAEADERIRGSNSLDPDLKAQFSDLLQDLLSAAKAAHGLAAAYAEGAENDNARASVWRRLFGGIEKYVKSNLTAEQFGERLVPLGIVGTSAIIGFLCAGPGGAVTGSVVASVALGETSATDAMKKLTGSESD